MSLRTFLQDDQASVAMEYVILVAFAAILLAAGVWVLFGAMRDFFSAWAGFFGG